MYYKVLISYFVLFNYLSKTEDKRIKLAPLMQLLHSWLNLKRISGLQEM